MDIAALQVRVGTTPDGKYGRVTRAAVLSALTVAAPTRVTDTDLQTLADSWQVDVAAIQAVRQVEANGSGFIAGRPTILFEPHRFSRATGHRFDRAYPTISYRDWGGRPYPSTQAARYDQLLTAIGLDVDAGFASASYGAFQILGENWRTCGETDPFAFALAEAHGEDAQLRHFVRFVASSGLVPALRRHDWAVFARGYNGTAFRVGRYDERLAAAWAQRASAIRT